MTIQKEIDNTFIARLESIIRVCEKTTSGNVSHNVATIKCKCRDMLQFYKKFPANSWHEIDEKLPPIDKDCLFMFFNGRKNVVGIGYMREDKSVRLEGEFSPILDIEEFDYWCEIPQFKEEKK